MLVAWHTSLRGCLGRPPRTGICLPLSPTVSCDQKIIKEQTGASFTEQLASKYEHRHFYILNEYIHTYIYIYIYNIYNYTHTHIYIYKHMSHQNPSLGWLMTWRLSRRLIWPAAGHIRSGHAGAGAFFGAVAAGSIALAGAGTSTLW